MAQVSLENCEICDENVGRHYCVDCEQLFCQVCKMSHLKTKSCKDHIFEEYDKVNSDVKKVRCQEHGQGVVYYCDTCSLLLCNICLPNLHKKHEFSLIKDAVAREKEALQNDIQLAGSQLSTFEDKVVTISKLIKEFKAANVKTVKEITKKGKDMKELVDKITSSYIDEVEREETKQLALKLEEQLKIKKAIMQGENVIRTVSSTLKDKNDTAFLAAVPEIKKSFIAIQGPEIQSLKKDTDKFETKRFRQTSTEADIQTKFQSIFGYVEDNSSSQEQNSDGREGKPDNSCETKSQEQNIGRRNRNAKSKWKRRNRKAKSKMESGHQDQGSENSDIDDCMGGSYDYGYGGVKLSNYCGYGGYGNYDSYYSANPNLMYGTAYQGRNGRRRGRSWLN